MSDDKKKKKKDDESILDLFFERDLTAAAAEGSLPPTFEMDEPVRRVTEVLSAGRGPVLVGDVGVGKTAVIQELVRRAADDPRSPVHGKRVLQFSLQRCAASLKQGEPIAERLVELVSVIAKKPEVVPYFRDYHLGYNMNLEHVFASLGYRLDNPVIAEGEVDLVRQMFEYTPELERDFVLVEIREPSLEKARRILHSWAGELEKQRSRPPFDEEAMECGLQLAYRFLTRSRLPRKVLEPMGQLAATAPEDGSVNEATVVDGFCQNYALPRVLVDPETPLDLDELRQRFRSKVLGQHEAVDAMVQMVSRVKAGLIDPRRPFGAFLFVGPTGVGKTHLARMLAEYLLGSPNRLIRINMADFPEERHAGTLFGDPDGHNHDAKRGLLTMRVAGHALAVLLLDEFEKAHEMVHDRFLQLFDEGSFMNGLSQTISCRSMMIIATSNAGAELWRGGALGFLKSENDADLIRELDHRLQEHFRFEFLNRFDRVVHFRALTREHIRTIALRELELLQERAGLKQRRHVLQFDEDVLDWLTAHGYDPYYGARFLRRTIEREISTPVAELLVRERPVRGAGISLVVRGNRIRAKLASDPETEIVGREAVRLPTPAGEENKVLSREALEDEARALLVASDARREALEEKRTEREALRTTLHDDPSFWSDHQVARRKLDRFRELDLAIRIESRYAQVLERLEEKLTQGNRDDLQAFARGVEKAAHALREWDARFADDAESAVWLVISKLDPLQDTSEWIEELARLQLAWCSRLDLDVETVGYVLTRGELQRVGLEVAGPGAGLFLAMESGVHRMHRGGETVQRARIDVVRQGQASGESLPVVERLKSRKSGLLDLNPTHRARLRLDRTGQVQDFVGEDPALLAQMLGDAAITLDSPAEGPSPVARVYGENGVGARDPRTEATVPKIKDALKGRLEPLIDAWRRQWS